MHPIFRFISFIFVLLLSSIHLIAQETPLTLEQNEASSAPVIESIVVTGSLVPRGDFVSNAPIATISSDQFEMSNTVNVESLVNSMPQVIGGADRSSTWGEGIATANLRGLGENRTLVLVNGRRFVPSFPDGGTVDLNFIPVGLIDRVEVLTGGASAAYGSDALAGVINFILREETDGWEMNMGAEMSEKGDAEIFNFNATSGGTFASGRGRYMVHFDALERRPVYFTDRALSREPLDEAADEMGNFLTDENGDLYLTSENIRGFNMFFCPRAIVPVHTEDAWDNIVDDNGDFVPVDWNRDCYGDNNINALQFLQMPQERNSFKGKISYDFDNVEVYADVYVSESDVPMALPASPMTSWPTGAIFNAAVEDSPFFSQETKEMISSFYINEWAEWPDWHTDSDGNGVIDTALFSPLWKSFENEVGMSRIDRKFDSVQLEIGLRGDLGDTWGYEVFGQVGEVESVIEPNPLLNFERINQGLMVNAQGECLDPSDGCVPVNIFSADIGQAATEFIAYPTGATKSVSKTQQSVYMATLSGNSADWFTIPGDPGPIGVVLGFEYLEIESEIATPSFIEELNFVGFADLPRSLDAAIDNVSVFGELLVPLISDVLGISFLEMELGFRLSDHSISGETDTFKIALSYYPTDDWQLRASFNKAMRSPAIDELYKETSRIVNGYVNDPCTQPPSWGPILYAGWNAIENTQEIRDLCVATGIPAENLFNGSSTGVDLPNDAGGNTNLGPEKGTTISYGLVWTPYSIEGLSISLDFFRVEIEDYIETSPVSNGRQMVANCYDLSLGIGGAGSASCNSIIRASDGTLAGVFTGYQNLGLHELRGWDANVSYGMEAFGGYLDINYFASKIKHRSISDSAFGETYYTCLGTFNDDCSLILDFPVTDYKHRMTLDWSKEDIQVQLIWKHISELKDGDDSTTYVREELRPFSTFDLSVRYGVNESWMITGGVKNLLDKKPQAIGFNDPNYMNRTDENVFQMGSPNTIPQYYDMFGRTFFFKLSSTF